MKSRQNVARLAFRFVLIVGIVNFFADMTYEGGRAIVGPFLGSLGASAAIVGFVAGFGKLVGYPLRSVSGYFADKVSLVPSFLWHLCGTSLRPSAVRVHPSGLSPTRKWIPDWGFPQPK